MRLLEFENKNIAIIGLGREGRAARDVLFRKFPDMPCTLINESPLQENLQPTRHALDRVEIANLKEAQLDRYDILLLSPGISRYRDEIRAAEDAGVLLVSGTQVWFSENPEARCICVSGTKGKSTTASLIAFLLEAAGKSVLLAGNIGKPLLTCLGETFDYNVMELSSFQLAGLQFNPEIGLLLSFFPEHLAWHGGESQYLEDKLNLVRSAKTAVVNAADEVLSVASDSVQGRLLFNTEAGYHADESGIYQHGERLMAIDDLPLRGVHNAVNICAALTVLEILGIERATSLAALPQFKSLPHRLEVIPRGTGVVCVNDSIATTPFAALAGLKAMPDCAVTQLLGGFERGVDWQAYVEYVLHNPPGSLVCMGQNGPRVFDDLQNAGVAPSNGLYLCDRLVDAFERAVQVTPQDGLILLSPGAASFPEFTDFEHRGAVFAELANGIL